MFISGSDLRKMRLEAGMTTVQMAKLASVKTRKTYENWEKNIGSPSMNQFIAMCIGCGFDSAEFVDMAVKRTSSSATVNMEQAAAH